MRHDDERDKPPGSAGTHDAEESSVDEQEAGTAQTGSDEDQIGNDDTPGMD